MIDIRTIEVSGFQGAILGMRNPFKNRDKSDSEFSVITGAELPELAVIGEKDLELAQKLIRAGGDDDSKFLRMIHVQADINAPLYWWKEYDTYKVSTVANSESTMHTIHKREFDISDFSHEHLLDDYTIDENWEFVDQTPELLLHDTIDMLNSLRKLYLQATEKKDYQKAKDYWYNMIQLLPTSYMQKRTVDLNYQTLRRIFFARKGHKLNEWAQFIDWIFELPYAEELICLTYKLDDRKPAPELTKKQIFMCKASKLMTDMTLNGATKEEIEQMVMYSVDIINSDKTGTDLDELYKKYDILTYQNKYGSVKP